MCVCVCIAFLHVCAYSHAQKSRKRTSYPLELKLQLVVSSLTWLLGTKFQSFQTESSTLKHCAISPEPTTLILYAYITCIINSYEKS